MYNVLFCLDVKPGFWCRWKNTKYLSTGCLWECFDLRGMKQQEAGERCPLTCDLVKEMLALMKTEGQLLCTSTYQVISMRTIFLFRHCLYWNYSVTGWHFDAFCTKGIASIIEIERDTFLCKLNGCNWIIAAFKLSVWKIKLIYSSARYEPVYCRKKSIGTWLFSK